MTRLRKEAMDILHSPDNLGYQGLHRYGTCGGTADCIRMGDTPIKNWAGIPAEMPNPDHLGGESVIQYQERRYACSKCPIGCGGEMKVDEEPYAVDSGHKPEYETLGAFGAMLLNDSVESVTLLNDICNRAGMDTISAGCTVAFAMECYDRGILTRDDLGGLDLTWGNPEAIVALTRQIAHNEGFGAVLADGVKVAVERIGPDAGVAAMHAHGEELPMHDPRLFPGLGMSYRADATPGRHTQASAWFHEVNAIAAGLDDFYEAYADKYNPRGKAGAHCVLSNFGHVVNAAGVCLFGANRLPARMIAEFLSATLGKEFTLEDLLETGARIATLRTAFNVREGHRPIDVKLPARVEGRPPLPGGPLKGVTLDTDTEVAEYLAAMGWDETGKPKKETLERLGLDFAAAELYPA
jgi:aldehyde:ferredoxin oxidoreductase